MKPFIIVFSSILIATSVTAQPVDSLWSRAYGGSNSDWCRDVLATADGGYLLAGSTNSFGVGTPQYSNMWLVKINSNGDSLWNRRYGGSNNDGCSSILATTDGGYVLAGTTNSFGAGTPQWANMWLVKTNANGDSLWSRTYGGIYGDECRSILQTSDGGYVLAGTTSSFGSGNTDFWLVKTDANGDSLWSRTYGGIYVDECRSILQISDGGYVLAGYTQPSGSSYDMWLVRTDANGDSLWSRRFGGAGNDWAVSILPTADGGFVLAGITHSFDVGGGDFWLVKTNANGDSLWSRTFGGSGDELDPVMQQAADGGYLLAGATWSFGAGQWDMWLVKTSANGDSLWSRTFGGAYSDYAGPTQPTADGGYMVAGSTQSFGGGPPLNVNWWLVKTGPDVFVPQPNIYVTPILLNFGDIFVGDSAALAMVIHSTGDTDLVISSIEVPIDFHSDFPGSQILPPGDSLIVQVTFAPTEVRDYTDTLYVISNAPDNMVSVELFGTGVASAAGETLLLPIQFELLPAYPNPFNAQTTINFSVPRSSNIELNVYDLQGRLVKELTKQIYSAGNHSVNWNASENSTGIYFVKMSGAEFSMTQKMVLLK